MPIYDPPISYSNIRNVTAEEIKEPILKLDKDVLEKLSIFFQVIQPRLYMPIKGDELPNILKENFE